MSAHEDRLAAVAWKREEAKRMRADGMSLRAIAQALWYSTHGPMHLFHDHPATERDGLSWPKTGGPNAAIQMQAFEAALGKARR